MPNRLAGETSPYLLQHANNPVDWYPWGQEALDRARREDKLIFLSIGYAACHWCHVMEHESFEDPGVAEHLNRSFVSVKVDREERPDLDEIYMAATMLFSGGHGGWPMSVFLAPDLRPIYAGTYFPKYDSYGRPGFRSLLQFLDQRWRTDRLPLVQNADKVVEAVRRLQRPSGEGALPGRELVSSAAAALHRAFDQARGGIPSGTNKFPQSLSLELLLRGHRLTGDSRYLSDVELTLEEICNGGIYDHLGGGLHRYSTDTDWLVPHFEKMLYDQALVVTALLQGMQATGSEAKRRLFESRVRGIADYVLRDLASPEGAFYSSEDADSEGMEGKFYIWTREEFDAVLDPDGARLAASHFGVSHAGNWMHPGDAHVPAGPKNVLHVARSVESLANDEGTTPDVIQERLSNAMERLLTARNERTRPALDNKVLTGWNGLMIAALARAAAVLDERRFGEAGVSAADYLLDTVFRDGRLHATCANGTGRLAAYSTDYAFLAEGLVALYEWSGERRHVLAAERLVETALEHYWDADKGAFYLTASDHEELLVRANTVQDGATPSANSSFALTLQRLAILLGRTDFRERAAQILRSHLDRSGRLVFQQELLLCALDAWHARWDEIGLLGPADDPRTRALLARIHGSFRPDKVVACADGPEPDPNERLPLLVRRGMIDGKPTAYVCHDYECQLPATNPDELFADSSPVTMR